MVVAPLSACGAPIWGTIRYGSPNSFRGRSLAAAAARQAVEVAWAAATAGAASM